MRNVKIIRKFPAIYLANQHPAKIIVEYFLDRPYNRWTRLIDQDALERTEHEIQQHISKIPMKNLQKRLELNRQRFYLHTLRDYAKPVYFYSDNTDRVFTHHISLRSLKSEFRRCLLSECYEYDLASCHLAIAAKIWGAQELQDFLMQGGDFWRFCIEKYRPLNDYNDLLNNQTKVYKKIKEFVKKGIYAFCNGLEPQYLCNILAKPRKIIHNYVDLWVSKPIQSLLQARNLAITTLRQQGYLQDAFNRILVTHNQWIRDDILFCTSEGSLLSRQITSYEVGIMTQIYQLALEHESQQKEKGESPEFYIVLDLHDAVVINYTKNSREKWEPQIMKRVKDFTDSIGIYTSLSLKG